jgi:hypothetical protein
MMNVKLKRQQRNGRIVRMDYLQSDIKVVVKYLRRRRPRGMSIGRWGRRSN